VDFHAALGTQVVRGQRLFTIHAQTTGELDYALDYARAQENMVHIGEAV
jgi:thymidine phosphorylase